MGQIKRILNCVAMKISFFFLLIFFSHLAAANATTKTNPKPLQKITERTTVKPETLSLSSLLTPAKGLSSSSSTGSAQYTFSKTSGGQTDTINYIRLCVAEPPNDTNCTTCGAPFTIISSGTPLAYSTYHISPAAIASYLSSNGMPSGTYNVGMYVQSSHTYCSGGGKYCSTLVDSASHNLCMTANNYNSTTSSITSVTQQDNGQAVLNTATAQFGYVADATTGIIQKCTLANNGDYGSCAQTPATPLWNNPQALTFATIAGTKYAYVPDAAQRVVYQCGVSTTGGAIGDLQTCTATPSASPDWDTPNNVTFATVSGTQYAYVSDQGVNLASGNIYRCAIDLAGATKGNFISCQTTPTSTPGFTWAPLGLAFATTSTTPATQYAYIADSSSRNIYRCTVNPNTGLFTTGSCTATPSSPAWGEADGIAFATASNGTQYAYVLYTNPTNTGAVYKCTFDTSSGALSSCSPTPSIGSIAAANPVNISFGLLNGTQYAYVSDYAGLVYKCSIGTAGAFTSCSATQQSWIASGTTFNYF